jgi:hypothetical protein
MHASRHRELGASRIAAVLTVIVLLGAASALFFLSRSNTNAPILELPADAARVPGTASGIPVTFAWSHGFGTLESRYPRRASHFVVCVLQAGQECAWPGTFAAGDSRLPLLVWTATAESLQRTSIELPEGATELYQPRYPTLDRPYRYTFAPPAPVPASTSGQPLRWTAGACNGELNARCRFAAARAMRLFGAVNLHAMEAANSAFGNPNLLQQDAIASNTGANDSGEFATEIRIWEILLNPSNPAQVRTDIDSGDFNDDTLIVLKNGKRVPRRDVPRDAAGGFDPKTIVGIFKPGGHEQVEVDAYANLAAGQSGISVAQISFMVTPPLPRRFAVSYTLDPDGEVPETDEADNSLAERSNRFQ